MHLTIWFRGTVAQKAKVIANFKNFTWKRAKMTSHKQTLIVTSIITLVLNFSQTSKAKSVYVITDRDSTVKAYRVVDEQIDKQTYAKNLDDHGGGAVGLALDPCSATLFVTYEGSNIIEMVNAKTMISEQNLGTTGWKMTKKPEKALYFIAISGRILSERNIQIRRGQL